MSRPIEGEAYIEHEQFGQDEYKAGTAGHVEPKADGGRVAAQIVIEHLRKYGPNARVVILGPDFNVLRDVALEGQFGLFRLYGDEFSQPNSHLIHIQFNHRGGGQVLQTAGWEAPKRISQQVFTCVWYENPDKTTPEVLKVVRMARDRIKNGIYVESSGGIVTTLVA